MMSESTHKFAHRWGHHKIWMESVAATAYITDLALSDFHVFDPLKHSKGGHHYTGN
jgi:hypothetical protein